MTALQTDGSSPRAPRQLGHARTMVFVTLSLLQLFHVMAIQTTAPLWRVGLWQNYRLTVAVLLGTALPAHILTGSVTSRGVVNMTAIAVAEAATCPRP